MFEVIKFSKKSKARLGIIKTFHGEIKTPAFVPVATKGTIKALPQIFFKEIGIQLAFVNTYHLVNHPGAEIIDKAGGIHKYANLNLPLMSDSGGFQVFSLAQKKRVKLRNDEETILVKIEEDRVVFRSNFNNKELEFTPEKSIDYQIKIGADLVMAFDECITYPTTYDYAKKATQRTHSWLLRCLDYFSKNKKNYQYIYGIIQGSVFEDLRKESAKFVINQPVDGIAVGGVSVGESKEEMRLAVNWISDYLPKDKPVHLLGVGRIDDIIDLVVYGIDTFDCSEPTRIARTGWLYQINDENNLKDFLTIIDIEKNIYKENFEKVDQKCNCYVCQNFTKAYLHHLFKEKEILASVLATYHNLYLMERFFEKIREEIANDKL
ncbi:Queuine tRNA-ribosyltransferase [bacterium HR35]|nr:Queuine tRNA-ribosyltransferase [bacterium HR35]